MKYKNQLIIGSSILVIILAVFLGARLIGNATQEEGTLGNSTISNEISDIADDGIIDNDKVDGNQDANKLNEEKNSKNTSRDSKEDEKIENTNEEKHTTSEIDNKENTNQTNDDVEDKEKTDDTDDTDKKLDENNTDDTNKEVEDKNEINDEKTSKTQDKDGNTIDKTTDSDKESKQSKEENVVYVFKNKYIVQPKETLSDITKKCLMANKLDASNNIYFEHAKSLISKVNNISDPNVIITGTEMIIPTKANFEGLLPKGEAYTVKKGDTLHNIVINKMSWCEYFEAKELLKKNNNITNENDIQAGIVIYIPDENGEV